MFCFTQLVRGRLPPGNRSTLLVYIIEKKENVKLFFHEAAIRPEDSKFYLLVYILAATQSQVKPLVQRPENFQLKHLIFTTFLHGVPPHPEGMKMWG